MPSDLQVDNIKDGSATKTLATLSSSAVTLHSDVTFPAGHVVKTYQKLFKGTQSIARGNGNAGQIPVSEYILVGTGASGDDGSPLSITCDTPKSSSSKYLVTAHLYFSNQNNGSTFFRIFYNNSGVSSDTSLPDLTNLEGQSDQTQFHLGYGHQSANEHPYAIHNASITYLWSPASALAQTISIKGISYSTSPFVVNRTDHNGDSNYNGRAISTLTIQEIAG